MISGGLIILTFKKLISQFKICPLISKYYTLIT